MTSPERIDYQGMPAIHLRSPDGAEAIVLEHGGHIVSWKPANGIERLYMSPESKFASGETGAWWCIPVIFPQFGGLGKLQAHGFARRMSWTLVDARIGEDYAIAHLRLTDTPETRAQWPHEFSLEIAVNVTGARLDIELEVNNTGTEAFDFMAALHTYFAVREVEECTIKGLRGQSCLDRLTNKEFLESNDAFMIDQEVDRIYYDTRKPLLLNEPQRGLVIQSEKHAGNGRVEPLGRSLRAARRHAQGRLPPHDLHRSRRDPRPGQTATGRRMVGSPDNNDIGLKYS